MRDVRWVLVAAPPLLLVSSLVVLWWAGFAPFPTEPVTVAGYQTAGFCVIGADHNWANCTPAADNPRPAGFGYGFRLGPDAGTGSKDRTYDHYGQWGVEGPLGCWDDGCADSWPETNLTWKIYMRREVPHFGLGAARWLVEGWPLDVRGTDGFWPETAFTTYAACMYRKPANTKDVWYRCMRIEPGEPWRVGNSRK